MIKDYDLEVFQSVCFLSGFCWKDLDAKTKEESTSYFDKCKHKKKHACADCWISLMPTRTPDSEYVLITKEGMRELVRRARLK